MVPTSQSICVVSRSTGTLVAETISTLSPVAVTGSYALRVLSGAHAGNQAVQRGRVHLAANQPATFVTLRLTQFQSAELTVQIDGQPGYDQRVTPAR